MTSPRRPLAARSHAALPTLAAAALAGVLVAAPRDVCAQSHPHDPHDPHAPHTAQRPPTPPADHPAPPAHPPTHHRRPPPAPPRPPRHHTAGVQMTVDTVF